MRELIGPHTTAPGQRRTWNDWVLWAEDGLIFVENQSDGEITMLPCSRATRRMRAWIDEAEVWDRKKQSADPRERAYAITRYDYLKGIIVALRDSIQDALQQGDPTDERIRKHKLRLFLRTKYQGTGASVSAELDALFNPPSTPIVFQEGSQWLARGPEGVDERI